MLLKIKKIYCRHELVFYRKNADRKKWCTFCEFYKRCDNIFLGCGEILGTLCYELPGMLDSDLYELTNYIYIPKIKKGS